MKNIIFIAPPAAGKGTMSSLLKAKYGYMHISTGDLLRDAKNQDNELGRKLVTMLSTLQSGNRIVSLLETKSYLLTGTFNGGEWDKIALQFNYKNCDVNIDDRGYGINCYARKNLI